MSSIVDKFISSEGFVELFATEGQPALELLASNPLAGFCLAQNQIFHKPVDQWPLAAARDQMQKPQREILGWLGFKPATEAVAKIGRKCLPEALTLERSLQLRRILVEDDTREMLAHLRRITGGVIELLASRQLRAAVAPQLLHSVADSDAEISTAETATLLRDTLKMRSMLRRRDPLSPFRSRNRILELHDELTADLNAQGKTHHSGQVFPTPPILGWQRAGEQIVPIRTPEALQALGREQRNCVASYRDKVSNGSVFIFRVAVQGEVCTLSLIKNNQGGYKVSEFKAACNGEPGALAQFVVRRWLEKEDTDKKLNILGAHRSSPHNRPLPSAPLKGGTVNGMQIGGQLFL